MKKFKKISIVIPVYNEVDTLEKLLETVKSVKLEGNLQKEIILVDDFSTDGTRKLLKKLESQHKIAYHKKNQGKGAALRTGFKKASGDIVLVQDADLEYNPLEYPKLLAPILEGKADVVYGSRFVGSGPHRVHLFWHSLGNRILTLFSNIFTNLNLTDMETCYKVFTKETLDRVVDQLKSDRFGFEPEITARIAKLRIRIYEVGISYAGRSYEEGKKINWRDGIAAFWHIIRFNLLD